MKFLSEEHENRFNNLVSMDRTYSEDIERHALFYIISGNDELFPRYDKIYDFKKNMLKASWSKTPLCSSGDKLMQLGVNLYNGNAKRNLSVCDVFSSLDRKNRRLALNAIEIRFPL